jgi:hypothetical protein
LSDLPHSISVTISFGPSVPILFSSQILMVHPRCKKKKDALYARKFLYVQ